MRTRKRRSKQMGFIIIGSLSLLFILTVGYAAFSTSLNLNAKGNIIGGSNGLTPGDLKNEYCNTTSGDGLYKDTYEEGRCIYKGTDPDNYITFNNEIWRIMSVESDGTLKIMKAASIGDMAWDSSAPNDWARPADLNTYLNTEYYNSLSSEARSLIQTHTWSIGPVTPSNSDLAAQIVSENSATWTGNIGLMTVSEFLRSNTNTEQCGNYSLNNTNSSTCKKTNYIVLTSGYLWTVSPHASTTVFVLHVDSTGSVYGNYIYFDYDGVLPAVYLKSDIHLDGEGTESSPYTIVS